MEKESDRNSVVKKLYELLDNKEQLKKDGWRILTIWECAIKGKTRLSPGKIVDASEKWLKEGKKDKVIKGK